MICLLPGMCLLLFLLHKITTMQNLPKDSFKILQSHTCNTCHAQQENVLCCHGDTILLHIGAEK